MLGSLGRAGLEMAFGMRAKWAREGKQARRSADGGPLLSLPFIVFLLFCFCVFVLVNVFISLSSANSPGFQILC